MTELCERCEEEGCEAEYGRKGALECRDRELALLRQKLAAAELENKAWRALVEWVRPNYKRSITIDLDGFAADDEHDGQQLARLRRNSEQFDATQVTLELATKLGLLDKAGG